MDTYKEQFAPADLEAAKALYDMLLQIETESLEAVASYVDWIKGQEPDLYADLLLLDIMRAAKYGRKHSS